MDLKNPNTRPDSWGIWAELLGWIGLVVLFSSGTLGLYFFGLKSWLTLGPFVFGLLAAGTGLILGFRPLLAKLKQRSGQFVAIAVVQSLLIALILIGLNLGAVIGGWSWDYSQAKVNSLSPQSQKVAQDLSTRVRIISFYEKSQPEQSILHHLIRRFERHTDQITFERFDPVIDIEMVEEFGITREGPRVVVQTQWTNVQERKEARFNIDLARQDHEESLTNALLQAVQQKPGHIVFLVGHQESDIRDEGPDGYEKAARALEAEGYEVSTINLVEKGALPIDANVVVVPGPKQALLPPEVKILEVFLRERGSLCFLLEPRFEHGLDAFLGTFGVQANQDLIMDASDFGQLFGTGPDTAIAVAYDEEHPIVNGFGNAATVFPRARSLSINPGAELTPSALVLTSDRTWGERDKVTSGDFQWNPGEVKGPITLMVAASGQATSDDKRALNLVVAGDSGFASNGYLELSANRNLWLNMMGWLRGKSERVAIRPYHRGANRIVLTQGKKEGLAFFLLYGMPIGILTLGLGRWLTRRRG